MTKYSELEITCGVPGKITTGLDTEYLLNGENLKKTHGVRRFEWAVTPEDCAIVIKTRDGKQITTKKEIKVLIIHTKYLTVVSNNTSKGTKFYRNGIDITEKLAVTCLSYACGAAGEVNELELVIA